MESRLDRLYEDLETGNLDLNDLAPKIKSLRQRQKQLMDSKGQAEEEIHDTYRRGLDIEVIKNQVEDLREVLEEGSAAERKAFIKSFVVEIEVTGGDAVMKYNLQQIAAGDPKTYPEVLSIVHDGGAEGTRTPYLLLAKQALSLMSYSPT